MKKTFLNIVITTNWMNATQTTELRDVEIKVENDFVSVTHNGRKVASFYVEPEIMFYKITVYKEYIESYFPANDGGNFIAVVDEIKQQIYNEYRNL